MTGTHNGDTRGTQAHDGDMGMEGKHNVMETWPCDGDTDTGWGHGHVMGTPLCHGGRAAFPQLGLVTVR